MDYGPLIHCQFERGSNAQAWDLVLELEGPSALHPGPYIEPPECCKPSVEMTHRVEPFPQTDTYTVELLAVHPDDDTRGVVITLKRLPWDLVEELHEGLKRLAVACKPRGSQTLAVGLGVWRAYPWVGRALLLAWADELGTVMERVGPKQAAREAPSGSTMEVA